MRLFFLTLLLLAIVSCHRSLRPSTSVLQAYKQFSLLAQIKSRLRENGMNSEERGELLDFAEELAPRDPELKLLRAAELKREARVDEAKRVLEEAIQLAPTFSPVLSAYGEILISIGHSNEGKHYCLYAAQLNPVDSVARSCAGRKLLKFNR